MNEMAVAFTISDIASVQFNTDSKKSKTSIASIIYFLTPLAKWIYYCVFLLSIQEAQVPPMANSRQLLYHILGVVHR